MTDPTPAPTGMSAARSRRRALRARLTGTATPEPEPARHAPPTLADLYARLLADPTATEEDPK